MRCSTFPPGEGIALHHPYKHQFIPLLRKADKHILILSERKERGNAGITQNVEEYLSHNDQSHPPWGREAPEISHLENSKPICYNKTADRFG